MLGVGKSRFPVAITDDPVRPIGVVVWFGEQTFGGVFKPRCYCRFVHGQAGLLVAFAACEVVAWLAIFADETCVRVRAAFSSAPALAFWLAAGGVLCLAVAFVLDLFIALKRNGRGE